MVSPWIFAWFVYCKELCFRQIRLHRLRNLVHFFMTEFIYLIVSNLLFLRERFLHYRILNLSRLQNDSVLSINREHHSLILNLYGVSIWVIVSLWLFLSLSLRTRLVDWWNSIRYLLDRQRMWIKINLLYFLFLWHYSDEWT